MILNAIRTTFARFGAGRRLAVCCLLPLVILAFPANAQKAFTPEQEEHLGDYIREYLKKNPDVIVDALRELERRRAETKSAQITNFIKLRNQAIFRAKSSPIGGNPDGDVTLVEFFDYNCPYCRKVTPGLFSMLKKDGKTRFVYKEFPILGETSVYAAKAALAVARQDAKLYERFHVALLEVRGRLNESSILATAKTVGVDVDRMKSDMNAPEIQQEIDRNRAIASRLGINGTPAFVVGTKVLNGLQPEAALQAAVNTARKERTASQSQK
jgi:protein-disulfide isomerase